MAGQLRICMFVVCLEILCDKLLMTLIIDFVAG